MMHDFVRPVGAWYGETLMSSADKVALTGCAKNTRCAPLSMR
jgi:hypothetical protein